MSDEYNSAEGQPVPKRDATYWLDKLKEYKTAIEDKWQTQREE